MTADSPDIADLAGKRVLLTGASGIIGRNLAARLLLAGADVHGTSRTDRNLDKLPISWWKGSFNDIDTTRSVLYSIKPDIIFHLSGMVSAANGIENVLPAYHSLVTSTINLLTVSANLGCERIVLIGSTNEPVGQDPNSPYAAAKWAASMYGRLYQKLYNLPIVIARPSVGYGPGQAADKLIPYVISRLANGESPQLSSGNWRTDWIYIDDMVEGIARCATVPGIEGCTLDIGTGEIASVREIVEQIVTLLDSPTEPQFGALPDRYAEHTPVANMAHTFEKLGWKPAVNLHEGLRRTVAEYTRVNSIA